MLADNVQQSVAASGSPAAHFVIAKTVAGSNALSLIVGQKKMYLTAESRRAAMATSGTSGPGRRVHPNVAGCAATGLGLRLQ